MKQSNFFVYITCNLQRTVLYIGMTNNLQRRIHEHTENKGLVKTFAGRYYCHHLIYYECFQSAAEAIAREKELKKWRREKKEILIKQLNPSWRFLNEEVMQWSRELSRSFW